MDRQAAIRYFNGLARAIGPDNLGMPVDATANAVNLGLAGIGYLGHKTGLLREPLALIDKPVGGSDWIAEKLGNPDDGTGAYSAGRITPLMAGMARMGGQGMVKAMDKLVAQGPASAGKAAQRGAIRVSRGPGDAPDDQLILSTSMNQELLPQLITKGGNAELYSPSMGIKRGQIMTEFGDLALIPKLGAFDPATSPSTLFNRDAYTARWTDFHGEAAADALKGKLGHLDLTGKPFESKLFSVLAPGSYFNSRPIEKNPDMAPVVEKFRSLVETKGEKYAVDRLQNLDTDVFTPDELQSYFALAKALGNNSAFYRLYPPYLPAKAELRLNDRLMSGVRPEDLRMNEGGKLGVPQKNDPLSGGFGGFWHDLSMETSPAFRNFQAFERSPLGAGLLRERSVDHGAFQKKVREKGFGDQFGWLGSSAQEDAVRMVPRGPGEMADVLSLKDLRDDATGAALQQDFLRNGFTTEQMLKAAPDLYKAAALVRRGIQHTPSDYAELKVMGSVPINPDSFAGAVVRGQIMPDVEDALKRLGLPVVVSPFDATPSEQWSTVQALQRGMAASRQPAK